MAHHPGGEGTAAAESLLRAQPPEPAPFADGELRLAEELGQFRRRVPVPHQALPKQLPERRLDPVEPLDEFPEFCVPRAAIAVHRTSPLLSFPRRLHFPIRLPSRVNDGGRAVVAASFLLLTVGRMPLYLYSPCSAG